MTLKAGKKEEANYSKLEISALLILYHHQIISALLILYPNFLFYFLSNYLYSLVVFLKICQTINADNDRVQCIYYHFLAQVTAQEHASKMIKSPAYNLTGGPWLHVSMQSVSITISLLKSQHQDDGSVFLSPACTEHKH